MILRVRRDARGNAVEEEYLDLDDKANGKEVGAVYIPAPQSGTPMTYMWQDKQYIVLAVSGAGYPGELLAFKLGT